MFKTKTVVVVFCAALGFSQGGRIPLTGRVEGDTRDIYVELREQGNRLIVEREMVAHDGTFHFRELAPGSYKVQVVTSLYGEILLEDFVDINPMTGPLLLRLPNRTKPRPPSGTISVKELQARVPKKAFQAFTKAQHFAESGQTGQAIEQLRVAVKLDPNWRDAHVNLGAEYARAGRCSEALAEFEEAQRIGPPAAILSTNYAATLASLGRMAEAESAVREALRLDPHCARAHYLLGHMLAAQPARAEEALKHLLASFAEVPNAHIVAAQVLLRRGDRAGVAAQLREYLATGDSAHRAEVEKALAEIEGQ